MNDLWTHDPFNDDDNFKTKVQNWFLAAIFYGKGIKNLYHVMLRRFRTGFSACRFFSIYYVNCKYKDMFLKVISTRSDGTFF